jgi:hypothetical protein
VEIAVISALLEELSENTTVLGVLDSFDPITLNHRVPGSSPGAPTKLFKDLHKPEREQSGLVRPKMSAVAASKVASKRPAPKALPISQARFANGIMRKCRVILVRAAYAGIGYPASSAALAMRSV